MDFLAWPSSSASSSAAGPSKTIKSKTSEQCKWQVMISLLCAVKRGARRSTRSRTKTKNQKTPKRKVRGHRTEDRGLGTEDWARKMRMRMLPLHTQQPRDANANANEDPKTWPKTMRDPSKYFTHTLCPKCSRASAPVDQINAIVCPFLVKLCALHKQIQQIQTTTELRLSLILIRGKGPKEQTMEITWPLSAVLLLLRVFLSSRGQQQIESSQEGSLAL